MVDPNQPLPAKLNEKGDQDLNVAFALGEVTGQLNVFMSTMKESIAGLSSQISGKTGDLEDRVKTIETWHIKVTALASTGGVILGWLMEWVIHHV